MRGQLERRHHGPRQSKGGGDFGWNGIGQGEEWVVLNTEEKAEEPLLMARLAAGYR